MSPGLAVVTGATAGIGREFCEQLAGRGHDLLLVARDGARLEGIGRELEGRYGIVAERWPADLAREDEVVRLAERLADAELSLLVNNAGFGTQETLARADPALQADMVRLHCLAVARLSQAALPALLRRGAGGIVNVSSVASFIYSPGNANYCATKAYMRVFTEGLAAELRGSGVRAQVLCPGFTHTEFHQRMGARKWPPIGWMWLSARDVVAASLRALDRGGPVVCVPGWQYRLLVGLIRLTPRPLLGRIADARRRM